MSVTVAQSPNVVPYVNESSIAFALSGVTAGNVLVLLIGNTVNNATFTATPPTGGGATWTQVQQITNSSGGAGNFAEAEVWVGIGGTGGSVTVTATPSTSSFCTGALFELSGASGVVDVSSTSSGTTTPLNGPSLTPGASGELMLTIITSADQTSGISSAPWVTNALTFSGSKFGGVGYYPAMTSGVAEQLVVTGSGSPFNYASAALILKATASANGNMLALLGF